MVRTETIEVQVPVTVPLESELTYVPPEPAPPPRSCTDAAGRATVCNRHLADAFDAVRAWGRGLAAQLRSIADLQPDPPTQTPKESP